MRTHGIGNQDITAGDVFDIDLMQAPFGLNAPLMVYNELTCARHCCPPYAPQLCFTLLACQANVQPDAPPLLPPSTNPLGVLPSILGQESQECSPLHALLCMPLVTAIELLGNQLASIPHYASTWFLQPFFVALFCRTRKGP